MNRSDILMHKSLGLTVELTHQCKTEQGIESDERFKITEIIDDFEQLVIENQYKQTITINPNQIK